jgi:hypothetical protein
MPRPSTKNSATCTNCGDWVDRARHLALREQISPTNIRLAVLCDDCALDTIRRRWAEGERQKSELEYLWTLKFDGTGELGDDDEEHRATRVS